MQNGRTEADVNLTGDFNVTNKRRSQARKPETKLMKKTKDQINNRITRRQLCDELVTRPGLPRPIAQ